MPPLALRSTWRCLVVAEFVKSKQWNPSTPAACLFTLLKTRVLPAAGRLASAVARRARESGPLVYFYLERRVCQHASAADHQKSYEALTLPAESTSSKKPPPYCLPETACCSNTRRCVTSVNCFEWIHFICCCCCTCRVRGRGRMLQSALVSLTCEGRHCDCIGQRQQRYERRKPFLANRMQILAHGGDSIGKHASVKQVPQPRRITARTSC